MDTTLLVLLILLSPLIAAAYYLITCFSIMGIVLLRETARFIRIEKVPAHSLTGAQFSAVCNRSMRSLFNHSGAGLFLYPFMLLVTQSVNRKNSRLDMKK